MPALLAALLVLVSGCGGDPAPPSEPLGAGGLARALELARSEGRMAMRLSATTTRPGRGTRPQFDADGEVDLGAGAGTATLHLDDVPGVPDLTVDWTADRVAVGDKSLPRERARVTGGQIGMLPDETQGLAELVTDARDVRERGNGHWTFTVTPQDAVRRGIPPQPEPAGSGAARPGPPATGACAASGSRCPRPPSATRSRPAWPRSSSGSADRRASSAHVDPARARADAGSRRRRPTRRAAGPIGRLHSSVQLISIRT